MPNRQYTIDIINNALQSDNKKVIVLKGNWGIGKTYLWKQIAEQNDKHSIFDICHKIQWLFSSKVRAKKEYKTGYVSLFGKKNFNEITQEAILSLYFKNKPSNIFEWILIKTKSFWFKLFGIPNFQTISQSFSAIFALLGIYSLKKTIICFDDIERMDNNIDFKDFLGFVNDLAEHQKCKVILIFNEKELFNVEKVENNSGNNDKNNADQIEISDKQIIYNKFKEKTIDLEVTYTPTFEDNFNIACSIINNNLDDRYKNTIKNLLNELEENNIRIISKCIECINDFINTVNNIKDKLKYYDDFSNTILLKIITSITYITQQYWKVGHRFWDSSYIENETNHLNDEEYSKALNKYPRNYSNYIFQGKYLDTLYTYFQGYKFDEEILYNYLKDYNLLIVYYNFEKQRNIYGEIFWNTIDGKIDEYVNNMCDLFNNKENAYSFFINMGHYAFQSFISDSSILKKSEKFKDLFYKQMNNAVNKYIEEYQNNFDIEYDYYMEKKIEFIYSTKTELLYKKPNNTDDYYKLLINILRGEDLESSIYLIEKIDNDKYKTICSENNKFFTKSITLFFGREQYKLEKTIPYFLYMVAQYLLYSIKINPDNEFKDNILCKHNLKKNNYIAKKDIEDYINKYRTTHHEKL